MFLDNIYTKRYYKIINHFLKNIPNGYTESHHVIPKCLGGNNDKANIVVLPARAHFICHWLLTKMVEKQAKYKMLEALSVFSNNTNRNIKLNSKELAIIREANAKASSLRNQGNQFWKFRQPDSDVLKSIKSTNAKKSRWVNNETIERFTQDHEEYIEQGYHYGRLSFNEKWKKKIVDALPRGPRPEKVKEKLRIAFTGRKHSEEHNKNVSIAKKNAPKITCEHCNIDQIELNYNRWHGDKCKHNPSRKNY